MDTTQAYRQIEQNFQFKVLVYISTLIAIITSTLGLFRFAWLRQPLSDHWLIPLAFTFCVISLFYLIKFRNLIPAKILFVLFGYVVLPMRFFLTGGVFTFTLGWVFFTVLGSFYLYPRKIFLVLATIWSFVLITPFFIKLEYIQLILFDDVSVATRTITLVLALLSIIFLLFFVKQRQDNTKEELGRVERVKTTQMLLNTSMHEILNPLATIKMATTIMSKKGIDDKKINEVLEASDRISSIVNEMQGITDVDGYEMHDNCEDNFSHIKLQNS